MRETGFAVRCLAVEFLFSIVYKGRTFNSSIWLAPFSAREPQTTDLSKQENFNHVSVDFRHIDWLLENFPLNFGIFKIRWMIHGTENQNEENRENGLALTKILWLRSVANCCRETKFSVRCKISRQVVVKIS